VVHIARGAYHKQQRQWIMQGIGFDDVQAAAPGSAQSAGSNCGVPCVGLGQSGHGMALQGMQMTGAKPKRR